MRPRSFPQVTRFRRGDLSSGCPRRVPDPRALDALLGCCGALGTTGSGALWRKGESVQGVWTR